jgi:hypothetical protein
VKQTKRCGVFPRGCCIPPPSRHRTFNERCLFRVLTPKAHHATDVRVLELDVVRSRFTASIGSRNGMCRANHFVRFRVAARIYEGTRSHFGGYLR